MSEERAKKIKLIIFDVDGVMTDGTIFLFPAPRWSLRERYPGPIATDGRRRRIRHRQPVSH